MALLPEGLLAQSLAGRVPERDGNHDPIWAPHAVYRCDGEDRWIAIAVASDEEWRSLASVVEPAWLQEDELAEVSGRKRREDEIDERLEQWCATRSREEATRVLQQVGVAALPVLDARDLHDDPHLAERGFFVELPHPEVGVRRHLGIPYRLHGSPLAVTRAAPCLGQDTDDVLTRVLGYDGARVAALRESGALR
jgi:benzylsuccinate CoA-transferase BbsF subunit